MFQMARANMHDWIGDNGATNHMTPMHVLFTSHFTGTRASLWGTPIKILWGNAHNAVFDSCGHAKFNSVEAPYTLYSWFNSKPAVCYSSQQTSCSGCLWEWQAHQFRYSTQQTFGKRKSWKVPLQTLIDFILVTLILLYAMLRLVIGAMVYCSMQPTTPSYMMCPKNWVPLQTLHFPFLW